MLSIAFKGGIITQLHKDTLSLVNVFDHVTRLSSYMQSMHFQGVKHIGSEVFDHTIEQSNWPPQRSKPQPCPYLIILVAVVLNANTRHHQAEKHFTSLHPCRVADLLKHAQPLQISRWIEGKQVTFL